MHPDFGFFKKIKLKTCCIADDNMGNKHTGRFLIMYNNDAISIIEGHTEVERSL